MKDWTHNITYHTFINENIKKVMDGFHYNAHPMGMFEATLGALSTFYPDAKDIFDVECRRKQIYRLIAKVPTIAAFAYRHRIGMQYAYPDNDLGYEGNFLNMMFKTTELKYKPNPVLERALSVLFILHADHEQNCSTNAMRSIGSAHTDPFSSLAGAAAALYGPLHGGANEMVLRMLKEIGSVDKVPDYIKRVKAGEFRLMGFGHRVYKNYDPRARIIKQVADEVFEVTGKDPMLDIALELERIALEDEYFVKRQLYPNVDFYSGIIYQAMRFPVDMFPVLFAIRLRTAEETRRQLLADAERQVETRRREAEVEERERAVKCAPRSRPRSRIGGSRSQRSRSASFGSRLTSNGSWSNSSAASKAQLIARFTSSNSRTTSKGRNNMRSTSCNESPG